MNSIATAESVSVQTLSTPDTNAATFIKWQEIPEWERWSGDPRFPKKRDWYQHLDDHNNGLVNGVWRNDRYYRILESYEIMQAVSSSLPLTQQERERSQGLFHGLKLDKWGEKKEHIAFVVCSYVIEETYKQGGSKERRGHPNASNRTLETIECQASLGLTDKRLHSLYGKFAHYIRTSNGEGVYKGVHILHNSGIETNIVDKHGGNTQPTTIVR
jgi:hypothetical protein